MAPFPKGQFPIVLSLKVFALELNIAPLKPMPSARASAGAEKRPGVPRQGLFSEKGHRGAAQEQAQCLTPDQMPNRLAKNIKSIFRKKMQP
ncbi:MAG: hypothetical protein ACI9UU_001516 [Candidatus Azotimanducaceae bacterium]